MYMGTNYYIHKENRLPTEDLIHIGKAVYKKPKGEFIWATPFTELDMSIDELMELEIVDEYGKRYSYVEFCELIGEREWNDDHIGENFS